MGRTFLVWVIFLLSVISAILEASAIFYLYSGAFQLPPQIVAYAAATPTEQVLSSLFADLFLLAPAIALFLMRRIALPLFIIAFVVELMQYSLEIYLRGWDTAMAEHGIVVALISIGLSILVCFYV